MNESTKKTPKKVGAVYTSISLAVEKAEILHDASLKHTRGNSSAFVAVLLTLYQNDKARFDKLIERVKK